MGLGHGDVKLAALHRGAALGGLVAGGANAQEFAIAFDHGVDTGDVM